VSELSHTAIRESIVIDAVASGGIIGSAIGSKVAVLEIPESAPDSFLKQSGLSGDASQEEMASSRAFSHSESSNEMRTAAVAIWRKCLETIRPQISSQSIRTWFEPLVATALEGSQITLRAPSNFFYEWITEHYYSLLLNALKDVLGPTATFHFDSISEPEGVNTTLTPSLTPNGEKQVTDNASGRNQDTRVQETQIPFNGGQNVARSGLQPIPQQTMQPANRTFPALNPTPQSQMIGGGQNGQVSRRPIVESNLNPRYTFDTFIRGESNKLAYAAAIAVANNPGGTSYNPLVLYGNVGLGKTHLIQAIGNLVQQKFSGSRVMYTSSDRFTVEFVDAIQNDRINEFTSLYRSIDVLIIDDVQFFAGKEKTQDIFFHTFNALRELGKQIILTCDRPPKELKDIDDRLLNRLQWGLTADMVAPDLETRIAILRHKALNDGIDLPSDVIEFIATNVSTNIRELEGCLISLLATASLESKDPTVELAREVLRKVAKRSAPILSIETIQRTVAKRFSVDEELLRAKTRKQEVVQARQVAMFLAKELTSSSLKTIGLHFGGRDHSTVIHACQTVSDDMRHNPMFATKVEELRRQFELMQ
jgi:chromosomal replication initiator protein